MEEIEVRNILGVLWKRIWLILLLTALLVAATGFVSYFVLKPEYIASATLLVGKPQEEGKTIEYSDILLNQQLVSTYGEILKSRFIGSEVIKNLGLNMRIEDLMNKFDVSYKKDTQLIVIEVKSDNPENAAKIADQITTVFINYIRYLVKTDNVQLIDSAQIPAKPSSPTPILNMMIAGVIGASLVIIIILTSEYMRNTFKSAKEIEDYLKLPVLGVIPKDKRAKRSNKGDKAQNVIFNNDDNSFYYEAFRSLRTSLQFSLINQNIKSIVVTSSEPGDGKSTIISHMAVSLSRLGNRVLLVDTDLRNPKIHEIFGLLNYKGITNILMEGIDFREIINSLSPGYPDVLTSGVVPHNPSEMLSSGRMKSLLEQLRQNYDIVLMDSPSVGLVSDAAILSSIADGVLVIYTSEKTKVELARSIKATLMKVNANILGVVLNKVSEKVMNYKSAYSKAYFNRFRYQRNETSNKVDVQKSEPSP